MFEAQLTDAVRYLQSTGKTPVLTGIVQTENTGVFDATINARVRAFDTITRKVAEQTGTLNAGWGEWRQVQRMQP